MPLKKMLKGQLQKLGYRISYIPSIPNDIPDHQFYTPLFSPWYGHGEFAQLYQYVQPYTLVSADRCHILYQLARQALSLRGDFWECGVYKGGTATLLAALLTTHAKLENQTKLHLFDTFEGMPETDPDKDLHQKGDFADTGLESVQERVLKQNSEAVVFHPGRIPQTFVGMEDAKIAFAHIDVDIYQSIWDCCEFIYPRLVPGSFMIFDDYGFPSCPGARQAVDEFFRTKPEQPLVLPTGQCIVFTVKQHRVISD
jgi:O-methyltransferase